MNFEAAKVNMIKQQIRACDVHNEYLLEQFNSTPREHFVPPELLHVAYADMQVPIGHGQVMMKPVEEGRLLNALQLKPSDIVLEIGTGTAYLTALMAKLSEFVYSMDIFPDFIKKAQHRLMHDNIHNVQLHAGDGALGWDTQAPYDAIAITGAMPELPKTFLQQLKIGGRLFAILGHDPIMEATVITRHGKQHWKTQRLFEMCIPPLLHAAHPPAFKF